MAHQRSKKLSETISNKKAMLHFLQESVWEDIAKGSDHPTERASALRELYKQHRLFAELCRDLVMLRQHYLLKESELPSIEDCLTNVESLERRPLRSRSFAALHWQNVDVGVLIRKEDLKGGGLVYTTTLFTRENGIRKFFRAEFRAARSQPEPFASMLTADGWIKIDRERIVEFPELSVCLQAMTALHKFCHTSVSPSDIDRADLGPGLPPKPNDKLVKLCRLAYTNKTTCTRVVVPIDKIIPGDMEFALQFPLEELRRLRGSFVDDGKASVEILLYEENGKLISDDDYYAYLTFKSLGFKRVPAVIIGDFIEDGITIIERGGCDLMPPIGIERREGNSRYVSDNEMEKLQLRLKALAPAEPNQSTKLSRVYFEFCRLLERRRKQEKDLHEFLRKNPILIDAHAAKIHSEVKIGRFRADLVFRYDQSDKRILLIELERDDDKLFTKSGRLTHKITHASQQIEDWIIAVRQNSPAIPEWLKSEYLPTGLVIAGRSISLSESEQTTLANINSNRSVKIITYDDLLDRLNRLITTMDTNTSVEPTA